MTSRNEIEIKKESNNKIRYKISIIFSARDITGVRYKIRYKMEYKVFFSIASRHKR